MNHSGGWPTTRVTLISLLRDSGDEAAWREFVDLYAPVVHAYCRRRGLQHADALNVAQEVFGHVSRAIQTFEYDRARGRFRSWLGLITHQQMLRYKEKQARNGRAPGNGRADGILEAFEGEAEGIWIETVNAHIYACALERVRQEFDAEEWRAFQRVWDGNERPGDVARDLGKESPWLYQIKHKAIGRLKQEVERLTDDVAIFNRM
jgi:RNA polymerase sigma-70 factor (ECF subfamily)